MLPDFNSDGDQFNDDYGELRLPISFARWRLRVVFVSIAVGAVPAAGVAAFSTLEVIRLGKDDARALEVVIEAFLQSFRVFGATDICLVRHAVALCRNCR